MELWGCVGYLPQVIVAVQLAMGFGQMYAPKEWEAKIVSVVVELTLRELGGRGKVSEIHSREGGYGWMDAPWDSDMSESGPVDKGIVCLGALVCAINTYKVMVPTLDMSIEVALPNFQQMMHAVRTASEVCSRGRADLVD